MSNTIFPNQEYYEPGTCGLAYEDWMLYVAINPLGAVCTDKNPFQGIARSGGLGWSHQTHRIFKGDVLILLSYETCRPARKQIAGTHGMSFVFYGKFLAGERVGWASVTRLAWRQMAIGYSNLAARGRQLGDKT